MQALVTGTNGFIERHLLRWLAASGVSVFCLGARPKAAPQRLRAASATLSDSASLTTVFEQVDIVFHCVSRGAAYKRGGQVATIQRRIEACANIATAASRCTQPPVVVLVSSIAAGGPARPAAPGQRHRARVEQDLPDPVSVNGLQKLCCEAVIGNCATRVPLTVVRAAYVYGEGQPQMRRWLRTAQRGVTPLFTPPHWRVSMIDVHDLCALLLRVGLQGERVTGRDPGSGCYNATGPEAPTAEELGRIVADALDLSEPRVMRVPTSLAYLGAAACSGAARLAGRSAAWSIDRSSELAAGPWWVSGDKAAVQLHGSTGTFLLDGLARTVAWYRDRHLL